MDEEQVEALAARIWHARRSGRTLTPLTDELTLDLADAYRIQAAIQRRREDAGQRRVGYKLGYTSAAMREQMGVTTMNYGPLTDAMLLEANQRVGADVLQPRVEPEIALVFARDLDAAGDVEAVIAAMSAAHAALEVVDSVWDDYRFRIEDNTADGSSACGVVLGPPLRAADLAAVTVVLEHNGREVARATGAEASGHPAVGVVWLAGQLAQHGEAVRAGDVVITGGLTHAVPLEPGDEVRATFDDHVEVGVSR